MRCCATCTQVLIDVIPDRATLLRIVDAIVEFERFLVRTSGAVFFQARQKASA